LDFQALSDSNALANFHFAARGRRPRLAWKRRAPPRCLPTPPILSPDALSVIEKREDVTKMFVLIPSRFGSAIRPTCAGALFCHYRDSVIAA